MTSTLVRSNDLRTHECPTFHASILFSVLVTRFDDDLIEPARLVRTETNETGVCQPHSNTSCFCTLISLP